MTRDKQTFVLDTNVLMHDPTAIYRFKEHDIFIPMIVLEELDNHKKGISEVARNVRQVSRFLDDLIRDATSEEIRQGLDIPVWGYLNQDESRGRIFFQTEKPVRLFRSDTVPGISPDNDILNTALALREKLENHTVTLVSKDINLRIKASLIGLNAEDYSNDEVIEDADLLYSGHIELDKDFWVENSKDMESWQEDGHTYYRIKGPDITDWHNNQCIWIYDDNDFEAIVRDKKDDYAFIEIADDFRNPNNSIWGITARNREQNFALNMLMNPDIDFVSLLGPAGTGKTLLTLAAGLVQVLDSSLYNEIIMTRVTVPVGEDIGFLPGTEEEKMSPWMGALDDNLEVLGGNRSRWEQETTNELLRSRISINSINFMRGRTFLNKYLVIDEAQNLTAKQMKTLITRAGPGTKIICLGNIAQIDTPYLTETTSGLTYVVDKFKNWKYAGHITLLRGERSRLAEYASIQL